MLQFDITADSRTGKVRTNNEDMLLVDSWYIRDNNISVSFSTDSSDRYLLALADGMGGHKSGEVASSDVLQNLCFFFNDLPVSLKTAEFTEAIFGWLESINHTFAAKSKTTPQYYEMGTTLVALAYYNKHFYWMNCGDSRLYRLHEGKLQQMTTDHSLNNLLGTSDHSNVITNCIGGGCTTSFIDLNDCTDLILPGDTFMLCSDGLSDMISNEQIQQLLNDGGNASALCQAAVNEGGFDNVSVIVAKCTEIGE